MGRSYVTRFAGGTLALTLAACALLARDPNVAPRADYAGAVESLQRLITHEIGDKQLPAVSIVLVDNQDVVWARGFGSADPDKRVPATAATPYRIGSISKLFTDIAVMQRVERGELDLDAPVTRYLPDFKPANRYGKPITLRQLMTHRSGLVREPPVGHYFDASGPTLAQTVASLNDTALVHAPGTATKYSNAALAVAGRILENAGNEPFAAYVERTVLDPLGMKDSTFAPDADLLRRLPKALMATIDDRRFPAPVLELGIAPAGSMVATVLDLGRFISVLLADGRGADGAVLRPETLHQMWTPQDAAPGAMSGYGIGFGVSQIDGRRVVGHSGALYGYAATLWLLPDEKLGVAVVTALDAAFEVTRRIAGHATQVMLAAKHHRAIPLPEMTAPIEPQRARSLDGRYASGDAHLDLIERAGTLHLFNAGSGHVRLRALGDDLIVDDRFAYGLRLTPRGDSLVVGDRTFRRVPLRKPAPAPKRWRGLIGEYGWDHNVLYVLERDGALWALIEWIEFNRLEPVSVGAPHGRDLFKFPEASFYAGERLEFTRDASGNATQARVGPVVFPRRKVGPEEGGSQLRIAPLRPVDELLVEARAAQPPEEKGEFLASDLVDVATLDSTIKLDIRYATTNNFLGAKFYSQPRAFLQRPAAEALLRAHRKLKKQGYGLLVHDAYRPWYVTKVFHDATPDDKKHFVADPAEGSRHNRGCAVDVTLYDLKTAKPAPMVATYDETTDRSNADYPGGTSLQRWHRGLLRDALEAEGFAIFPLEWWHFDFAGWKKYPIGNQTFEELAGANP